MHFKSTLCGLDPSTRNYKMPPCDLQPLSALLLPRGRSGYPGAWDTAGLLYLIRSMREQTTSCDIVTIYSLRLCLMMPAGDQMVLKVSVEKAKSRNKNLAFVTFSILWCLYQCLHTVVSCNNDTAGIRKKYHNIQTIETSGINFLCFVTVGILT